MARAVNQTIAWIAALFLSLVVFGVGLAIVFSLKPKHGKDSDGHESVTEHGGSAASDHGEHKSGDHHEAIGPEHPADSEHAKTKVRHEDPHAKDGSEDEKEITPASVRAKTEEHTPEAKPHH